MSKAGGRNALITSAMLVAGIRLWMQIRGKTKTPFQEWAIGWGATFFFLAVLSEAAPTAAGSLSLLIATSDFLINGVGLTQDITGLVSGTETSSDAGFVANPFASSTANTQKSNSPRESTKVSHP